MNRTLVLGGVAAGLLASAIVASPAQAEKVPAKPLAQTNFAAQQIAAFWFGENAANLIAATPYNVETKVSSKVVAHMPKAATSSKPGVVGSSGDQKASTAKLKNVNLPRSSGKVFFIGADKKPHWCSATALQSRHKNIVATAGHCVFDTVKEKATLDKWVFIPGYYQGKAPWGIYVGKVAFTHFDYSVYHDADYDYAFVAVYNGVEITSDKPASAKDFAYQSDLFDTKQAAYAHLAKVKRDKSTVFSKLWVREVEAKGHVGWVPAKVNDVKVANPGKDLTDPKVTLKQGWKADAPKEIGRREYNSNESSYTSKDGLTLLWKASVEERQGGNKYTVTKYYKRTFTKLERAVGAGKKYQVVGQKMTIGLKDVGKLGANVSGQGLAYNQKVGQPTFVFGYPSGSHPDGDHAFTGKTLKYSYGKTFPATAPSIKGEALVGIKSSFTGEGALGSGWLYKYDNNKRFGYLNGVTISVSDTDGNNRYDTSLSPYFNGETLEVYNAAAATDSGNIV
ncbi:hypothetical protein GCM10010116_16500 [Microbispora rosea subsp. aerata]|nr:hypothetical protein [Microbispora rosea]GGO08160.1 hypothetical protein GCM10010116_16500 [Microbispora rosea subsp. aerata]GIH55466.1 hypothetical protein Mro02_23800 [Microbispora rosea subsp. aerata]GLJ84663.1 hypothetical protein GCM10017588_33910 [Microbispora rosea subsp. aerata]